MFKDWKHILPSFPPLFYSFLFSGKHFIRGFLFNKVKELLKEKRSVETSIFMNFTTDYRLTGCIIVLSALRFFHCCEW